MHHNTYTFKKINNTGLIIITTFILTFLFSPMLSACEINFKLMGEEKTIYEVDDEIIVLLEVKLTHRVCPEGIESTDYKTDGVDIVAATKWKETSPNVWKRKLKLKVEGNKKGKLMLSATRTCDKEGGFGSIDFQATPANVVAKDTDNQIDQN